MTGQFSRFLSAVAQPSRAGQVQTALPIFADDLMVLNYALTLEHLENAFYKQVLASGKLQGNAAAYLTIIGQHEQAHVDALTAAITGAGGMPVKQRKSYAFDKLGDLSTQDGILAVAAKLEATGVAAYDGAAREIVNKTVLGAAGSIVAVEARHTGIIRALIDPNANPVPKAFEDLLRPADVVGMVAPILGPGADQQPLDADAQEVVDQIAASGPPFYLLTPQEARKGPSVKDATLAVAKKRGLSTDPEPVGKVENTTIPGPGGALPVRVYTPAGTGPFPIIVYFHGGGWVLFNTDVYDASCRGLTNGAKAVVVSVDYRQGPENRFPAAHDDAYAAYRYVLANAAQFGGDPKRVAVAGESAGGNLATTVCLQAKAGGVAQPVYQLLVYPITNYAFDTASYNENAEAIPLNKPGMQWFFRYYLNNPQEGADPRVSPLRAPDLAGLAPATVITDEVDPLRDEGEAYAQRLRDAGVAVKSMRYPGVMHEFFSMPLVIAKAKQAQAMASADLRAAFGK